MTDTEKLSAFTKELRQLLDKYGVDITSIASMTDGQTYAVAYVYHGGVIDNTVSVDTAMLNFGEIVE